MSDTPVQVNASLPAFVRDRMDELARARGISRSQLIRWGVGLAWRAHEAAEKGGRVVEIEPDGRERELVLPF